MHPGVIHPSPKTGTRPLVIDVRSPYVGKISPPYQAPKCDRPAHFEWKGKLFDVHGREIIPGQPLPSEEADPGPAAATVAAVGFDEEPVPPQQILVEIDDMPMAKLRALAGRLLGEENLHRTKAQIAAQLRDLVDLTSQTKHQSSAARLARAARGRESAMDQEWYRGKPQANDANGVAEMEVVDNID